MRHHLFSKLISTHRQWHRLTLAIVLLGVVRCPLALAQTEAQDPWQKHVERLRERLPGAGFHIVVEKPFVVIGDESPEMLGRRCRSIRWAVGRLKEQYFAEDPDHIVDIWLFRDKSSYQKNVEAMFGERPGTPFGYYSPRHRALVMNISTGGGTLVHEIVHPFMERNFPNCPAWFNEGLASLYEQSGDRDNTIVGFTNWRLNGLQRAIAAGQVPDFRALCETTTHEFYREDPGTNYAQARYLCYYLQQHGLLNQYYHAFVKNCESDPSGYQTLVSILGDPDMQEFQRAWQSFTARLEFPQR